MRTDHLAIAYLRESIFLYCAAAGPPHPALRQPCSQPQGVWIAGAIGLTMTVLLWNNCPAVFAAMGAKPEVAAPAVAYMRARCLASPAILCYYVMSGTFRGFKDTRWVLGCW